MSSDYYGSIAGESLAAMTQEVLEWGRADGWHDKPVSFGEAMAMLHSEVSEALEAWRQWDIADATDPQSEEDERAGILPKPEGVGSEFADVLIRLLDSCVRFGVDLEAEYERKMEYNRAHPHRHGEAAVMAPAGTAEAITQEELARAIAVHTGWKAAPCEKDAADLFRIAMEGREPAVPERVPVQPAASTEGLTHA